MSSMKLPKMLKLIFSHLEEGEGGESLEAWAYTEDIGRVTQ